MIDHYREYLSLDKTLNRLYQNDRSGLNYANNQMIIRISSKMDFVFRLLSIKQINMLDARDTKKYIHEGDEEN